MFVEEIIVVADEPNDTSFQVERVFRDSRIPVKFLLNKGSGVFQAIETAFMESDKDKYIVCAADEIMPLLEIDKMAMALSKGIEFVSATRYSAGGKRYGGNPTGKFLSRFANLYLRIQFRNVMSDFTTGYKGFTRKSWKVLAKNADGVGWSFALKFSINAIQNKLVICEIPIISLDRAMGGTSTYSANKWIYGYIKKLFLND